MTKLCVCERVVRDKVLFEELRVTKLCLKELCVKSCM